MDAQKDTAIPQLTSTPVADKVIALTFDDGPNTSTTTEILDVLEKHGAVASFFLVGKLIDQETAVVVKRAYEMGCEINNHSWDHEDMTPLQACEMLAQLEDTSRRIEQITGESARFFRPPYIAVNDLLFETIPLPFICGYGVEDFKETVTADDRYHGVLQKAKDGGIILLHDKAGNAMTVEAVDRLIPALREQGYRLVTVSALFAAKKIVPDASAQILYSYAEQTTMYG